MKKIRLDPGDLRVESFVTSDSIGDGAGTVFQMGNTHCDGTCDGALPSCDGLGGCPSLAGCDWTNAEAMSCTVGPPPYPTFAECQPTETEVGCTFYDDCEGLSETLEECEQEPESGGF